MTTPELQQTANEIRRAIITSLVNAGSGHSAGPLGLADVFTALYFDVLTLDPTDPWMAGRDRLIVSCGHVCPVWYATLAHRDYFSREKLQQLRKMDSGLEGHPKRASLPGVENTGGPLGQGVSVSCGVAKAAKMDGHAWHTFCITSDGEQNEGQTWEAALFAAKYKLNNLTWIMDRNNIQIDGFTEDVMPLEPIADKYKAFGWMVKEINGNDMEEVLAALREAKNHRERPLLIIARTMPGKGVQLMEGKFEWHGKPPSAGEAVAALHDLRTLQGQIEKE